MQEPKFVTNSRFKAIGPSLLPRADEMIFVGVHSLCLSISLSNFESFSNSSSPKADFWCHKSQSRVCVWDIILCYSVTEPQNLDVRKGLRAPPYFSVQKVFILLPVPVCNSLLGTFPDAESFDDFSRWSQRLRKSCLTLGWSLSLDMFQALSLVFTWITVYRASFSVFSLVRSQNIGILLSLSIIFFRL